MRAQAGNSAAISERGARSPDTRPEGRVGF